MYKYPDKNILILSAEIFNMHFIRVFQNNVGFKICITFIK